MGSPDYVLKFRGGRNEFRHGFAWVPCLVFFGFVAWFLAGELFVGDVFFDFIPIWAYAVCLLSFVLMLVFGKSEVMPFPCEMHFFRDCLVYCCERYDRRGRLVRTDCYRFDYIDKPECTYKVRSGSLSIRGFYEAEYCIHRNGKEINGKASGESGVSFLTLLEPGIRFEDEIESHSPLRVTCEEV